jgi:dolichol-phosphate mannosyltransferase
MKQHMQPISVIVPTLNEADNLTLLFARIDKSLSQVNIDYEIVVIDDHSTDGTVEVAKQADPKYNVRVYLKQGTPGKAFSLLEGFSVATYELVCMIDADLQYPPEAIPLMYHKLQYCEADIVVTERVDNKTSALRRLSSFVFNAVFTRMLFGINYDTQSGLKLFRKSILNTIYLSPSPWTFDLEFIVRSLEQGYSIVSQQIEFSERNAGVPKVKLLSATVEIASGSYKLWRNSSSKHVKSSYKRSEWLQRSFVSLALLATASGLVLSQTAHAAALPVVGVPVFSQILTPNSVDPKDPHNSDNNDGDTNSPAVIAVSSGRSTTSAPVNNPTPSNASQPTASTTATATSTPTTDKQIAQVVVARSIAPAVPVALATTSNPTTSHVSSPITLSSTTKYYPASALGDAKTHKLLHVASLIAIAGAAFVAIGLTIHGVKLLLTKLQRQPLKV